MTAIYIAFAVGLTLGACLAVVALSAVAMGKLGEDPLAEIEIPQSPIPRQYQD